MQFPTLRTILISLAGVTIAGLSCIGTIYAINTIADGWRIGAGGGAAYSGKTGGFGTMIQNPNGGRSSYYRARRTGGDIFVPTRTAAEWNAVNAAATAAIGLEIKPNGLIWRSWRDSPGGPLNMGAAPHDCEYRIDIYCNDETFGAWNDGVSVSTAWCDSYDRNSNANPYPHYYRYCSQGWNGSWHWH